MKESRVELFLVKRKRKRVGYHKVKGNPREGEELKTKTNEEEERELWEKGKGEEKKNEEGSRGEGFGFPLTRSSCDFQDAGRAPSLCSPK